MQTPYFYEPAIIDNNTAFQLSEESSKHCSQVLRMKEGEELQLTDGSGNLFNAVITSANKKNTVVHIQSTINIPASTIKIALGVSLLKNTNRFEWLLEKATEIGVNEIIPLLCKRTERQHFRFDRMNNILISAMLQSQQAWLPKLHLPTNFIDVIPSTNYTTKLIAHCEEADKSVITATHKTKETIILIGPEGDFTIEEIQLAIQQQYQPVTLGNTRLRTETAAMVAITLLNLQ